METKTFPDFSFAAGIRRVAEHLDSLAADPVNWEPGTPDHCIGHLTIRSNFWSLKDAATLLRNHSKPYALRPFSRTETDVLKMDAVRHCGSPAAALKTIRRQLDTQGKSMVPADLKRCERAARLIEGHIANETLVAAQAAEDAALLARIAAGEVPDSLAITLTGTHVAVTHDCRHYLGTVSSCKIGPHPTLGAKHRTAIYTIKVSHIRETQSSRYAYFWAKMPDLKRVIALGIRILPQKEPFAV